MKFEIERDAFLKILAKVKPAVEPKSTMPILGHVLIQADADGLTLKATDLYEALLVVYGEVEVVAPGQISVPCRDLEARVKAMPAGTITVRLDGFKVHLSRGSRRFAIHGLPAEEFPTLPELNAANGKQVCQAVHAGTWRRLVEATRKAVSDDETRPHLSSLLLEVGAGKAAATATDGHRLSRCELQSDEGSEHLAALIPRRGVDAITKAFFDLADDESLSMVVQGPHLFVSAGAVRAAVKITDEQFPPWQQVVPEVDDMVSFDLDSKEFVDALKAVELAASDRTGAVTIKPTKKSFELTVDGLDGEAGDSVEATFKGKGKVELDPIGVRAKYLLEALEAIDVERPEVLVKGALDPILVKGGDCFAVVMPTRI